MNIDFRYIDYNSNKNILFDTIQEYTKADNLIITEDGMAKKFYFSYINSKKMRIFENILSFDEFLNNIFFTNKYILKDIKRFLAFYSCLKKDIKEKLNIKNYYDCIEIADDFFEYFVYIDDDKKLKSLNLSKWQKEKIEIFYEIKKDFDIFLEKNNYLPLDWLYKKENLDLSYLKKYKKIIFFDIIDFPYNFSEILNELKKHIEIEIVLQLKKEDYDTRVYKIKNISLPERNLDLTLSSYKNDFELYNIIENTKKNVNYKNLEIYSANMNIESSYSIFSSNKHIFNDTKLYQILESYINLIEVVDIKDKTIDLFKLKENIFKAIFMEFYGLDVEDYKTFEKILNDNYRYISLELLENNYFVYYLKENSNLQEKLKTILKTILDIENIRNIEDLNLFFKEKFFSNDKDIEYFFENKYLTIYDKFYEILGILNSNENTEYFKDFSKFFEKNIGKNIFILFFNYLNKITLYEKNIVEDEEKLYLKDLFTAKFFINNNENEVLLVHTDNQNLPKIKRNFTLFTEAQKAKLGIKTNEDFLLFEKYRFFQNLLNFSKINIYSVVNLDENIEFSAFIYEYANKYKFLENKEKINFIENLYNEEALKNKKSNTLNLSNFRAYKKEKTDFKDGVLKIGAYDYISILEGETFFFLNKLCQLSSKEEAEEENGISARILGIILHNTMEEIFKTNKKSIESSIDNILISREEITGVLKKFIKKEKLKFEKFMSIYIDEVLILRLENNIMKFLEFLYNELKQDKILKIEAEKSNNHKEVPFLEANDVQVFLTGRADLIIETNRARYIVDLKTGKSKEKDLKTQLNFYVVMFYGNVGNILPVYSFAYNFWDENEASNIKLEEKNILELKEEMTENLIKFLENPIYELPKKSALKEGKFDFKKYYNYKYLCPLDKIGADE